MPEPDGKADPEDEVFGDSVFRFARRYRSGEGLAGGCELNDALEKSGTFISIIERGLDVYCATLGNEIAESS